ncbi:MAG: Uma2 family endonuclease [Nitrospirae bacterium]|nr:Uma2 family endonuclease [Nitrospirota bacterium]
MEPSPFRKHQNISTNIYDLIRQHIRKTKAGKVYYSPLDVILQEDEQKLQPDILFIRLSMFTLPHVLSRFLGRKVYCLALANLFYFYLLLLAS